MVGQQGRSDPVCESAHYIATIQKGELRLVLVQQGRVEPVGATSDQVSVEGAPTRSEFERPSPPRGGAWGVIRRVLGFLL
jgi:hypothetical protein